MATSAVIGSTVGGRYQVQRRLASGGLATVYEAEHVDLGKRVAIKFLDERFAGSKEIAERFRREARAASAVESEHIVQVFDVGDDAAHGLYIVMELLKGEDLGERLAREGRLDPHVATVIALQAAIGLAKAHARGIIHRDLKPENLFLVDRGPGAVFAKIVDFGIAKLTSDLTGDGTALTACGLTLGTPQYMSPEQINACPDVDVRTDIWSLGAVLFEALAGRPAFVAQESYVDTVVQICRERAPLLASVAPWVPRSLAAVVDATLEPHREARIPNASALAARLLEAMPSAGMSMRAPSFASMPAPRASAPSPPIYELHDISSNDVGRDANGEAEKLLLRSSSSLRANRALSPSSAPAYVDPSTTLLGLPPRAAPRPPAPASMGAASVRPVSAMVLSTPAPTYPPPTLASLAATSNTSPPRGERVPTSVLASASLVIAFALGAGGFAVGRAFRSAHVASASQPTASAPSRPPAPPSMTITDALRIDAGARRDRHVRPPDAGPQRAKK